ncbi:ParB/RepB/Spo0J family partition protein [Blautia wexlerae]|uniref:ParB/RepB/Spo0J family partition protein n=1 Tax=Blautia wexlerae TaxID=418240 RepID=UPI0034A4CC83
MGKRFNPRDLLGIQSLPQRREDQTIVYRDPRELIPTQENFYNTRNIEKLKASIKITGYLMQPILIENVNEKDRVLAGHRRRLCCIDLINEGDTRFEKVPCMYASEIKIPGMETLSLEDKEKIEPILRQFKVIQTNNYRDKSDWEKMQEFLEMEKIVKQFKESMGLKGNLRDELKELMGISGGQYSRYKKISNNLIEELMKEFKEERIKISVADAVASLKPELQQQSYEIFMENGTLTPSDVELLKNQQALNADIPGQMTIEQATRQQKPEEDETLIPVELQIERFFEALNKGERERVLKCDTRMAAYLISIRYRDVRIRNGHFNYQANKEGITFNHDSTMQHSLTWNELSEELVKRFGKKQKPVRIVSIDTPEKPQNSPKEQTETQEKDQGVRCIAGKSKSGICGSAYYCSAPYACCVNCPEECDIRCGWIEKRCQTEADAPDKKQQKDHTGETTEMLKDNANSDLPVMRNNDQRKEWLRNYKSWGLWYEDKNIEVKYYKYDFDNGARLIVEEYTPDLENNKSWWVSSIKESYYMHLVGGPEPDRAGGVPKWTYHTRYNKFPNSETELVEFLKEIQK